MSLTFGRGPLSRRRPTDVNYALDGPEHLLLFEDFPRRVRAVFAGETVADTRRGKLLHETGHLPVLYFPEQDLRADLLHASDHRTHCPVKGGASYRSAQVGDRRADNAVWAYRDPIPSAGFLRGYGAIEWDAMDAWYDEAEHIRGHLRDPYHRVDVRRSDRHVRVLFGAQVIAETVHPMLLSETGMPTRFYIPPDDVRSGWLEPSETIGICPYKGVSTYWSLRHGVDVVPDVAWSYPDPLENALKATDHVCFLHAALTVEVDGTPV